MIRHVVMWVFPDESAGRTRSENVQRAAELLQALPAEISTIRRFEVGVDELGGDRQAHLVLESEFDDWDALEHYQQHPAHLEVVAFFREASTTRYAVDYELAAPPTGATEPVDRRTIRRVHALNEMRILEQEGAGGYHLVGFGLGRLEVERSGHPWQHLRVVLPSDALLDSLRAAGWQVVGRWLPFTYLKRPAPATNGTADGRS